jgi:hypothetical protein
MANRRISPSLQHRDNRRDGCPIAAMGSELTRSGTKTREAVTAEFQKLVETLAGEFEGRFIHA